MKIIQESLDLSKPKELQQKVFVDCMTYFANRGMENLREMRPGDFVLHEEKGHEFFTLRDMGTKNHQADEEESQGGQMHEIPGERCPVKNLKKYIAKLNPCCEYMWQRPKLRKLCHDENVWYDNVPLGKNTLSSMTKSISEAAGCSKCYTNHSLRATSISILDRAGFPSRSIMTVSGHRSETSIKSYARTSEERKKEMSNTLSTKIQFSASACGSKSKDTVLENVPNPIHDQPSTSSDNFADNMFDDNDMFTDSQLERVLDAIPNSHPGHPLQDVTNQNNAGATSAPTPTSNLSMSLVSANSQPHYHFHGCVVQIFNK